MGNASHNKILIIEDAKVERMLLKTMFEQRDFDVTFCVDGQEAWNWINENDPPGLVVLDLTLPNIDGFELIDHIRSKVAWKQTPVLVTSAHKDRNTVVAAITRGASGYIAKPFDVARLLSEVNKLLKIETTEE